MSGSEYRFRRFPTTRWSQLERVARGDERSSRQSLEWLLGLYLPALRSHLIFRKHMAPEVADDLLQGFVAAKVLDDGLLRQARRERGKFRTFLLTSLDNYIADEMRREDARKRRGSSSLQRSLDPTVEKANTAGPAQSFEVKWAQQTLAEALRRMEAECRASGRDDCWGIFEARVMAPTLDQVEPVPYDQLVERYKLRSPAQASNLLITAKRMFTRALHSVISTYTSEDNVDDEIRELLVVLSTRA